MSTSPQRGHVVRIVVMSPEVSDTGARRLSPAPRDETEGLRRSVPVAIPGPSRQLADSLAELRRFDDLCIRPQPEQEPVEPLEAARRELDLEPAVPELGLARRLVVLGDPAGVRPQTQRHADVVNAGRVQRATRAP